MKTTIRCLLSKLILVFLFLLGPPVRLAIADELAELSERVCSFSERYAKDVSNVQVDFSAELAGRTFHGQAAIHKGVLPSNFPQNGAFLGRSSELGKLVVRGGNSQYSFKIVKQDESSTFTLAELVVQSGKDSIYTSWRPKSIMYAHCMTIDFGVVFAPIITGNVATQELFQNSQIKRKLISVDGEKAVVEFAFPPEHVSEHTSVRVTFGSRGEVLDSQIHDQRTEMNADGWSTFTLMYSQSEKTPSGIPLPQEVQGVTRLKQGDSTTSTNIVLKANNYRFESRDIEEFTLTHYGFSEPEGSTVLGRPVPFWLLGTLAGTGFLGLAIYLRKRGSR